MSLDYQTILFLSLLTVAWSEYCQNCNSSPCGFYGKDYEWCFTGAAGRDKSSIFEVIRSFGGSFDRQRCIQGKCPSELPCSNWLDGMDATGGDSWPTLRGLTKSQCLEKCRETSGCVGVVLVASDNDYKGSYVTGNCHRKSDLSEEAGRSWTTLWSRSKFTGFLNNCDRTVNPGQITADPESSRLDGLLDQWVPGGLQGIASELGPLLGLGSTTTLVPTTTAVYDTNLTDEGDAYLRKIYKICGKLPDGHSTELIVKNIGGKVSAPWIVSLGFYEKTVYYHQCGGSLITSKHVLTAAHCIASDLFKEDDWKVRLGDKNLTNNNDDINVIEQGITRAMMHPNFRKTRKGDTQSLYFDIGIIIMDREAEGFTPICLPKTSIADSSSLVNQAITVIGYGVHDDWDFSRNDNARDLLVETAAVRSRAECNNAHKNAGKDEERVKAALPDLFIDSLFCADQDLNKKTGPCNGDSGSPALQRIFEQGDQIYIQGIVSGTIHCASEQYPNFYTLVASKDILPWIKKEAFDSEYNFPDKDLAGIACFGEQDCPDDFTCSAETGSCLKPASTSGLYLNVASPFCPEKAPCLIRGSCHTPQCNRHGICWCSQFKKSSVRSGRSSPEEDILGGRRCKEHCECPSSSPFCIEGKCDTDMFLSTRNCSNIYNFLPANLTEWNIPCNSEADCPRSWFCSKRCYPPSSNPSGSSDRSLYVPTVSGLSHTSQSCLNCGQLYVCPPLSPCSDGSHCRKPICTGNLSFCWCDLFASRIKKQEVCLLLKSCDGIQHQIESARKLPRAERNFEFRKIQKFIGKKKCTLENGGKGVLCEPINH